MLRAARNTPHHWKAASYDVASGIGQPMNGVDLEADDKPPVSVNSTHALIDVCSM